MTARPTRPKPQTISDANARPDATMAMRVIANAMSFGIRDCSRCCIGHTMAIMKSARTSGAKTLAA